MIADLWKGWPNNYYQRNSRRKILILLFFQNNIKSHLIPHHLYFFNNIILHRHISMMDTMKISVNFFNFIDNFHALYNFSKDTIPPAKKSFIFKVISRVVRGIDKKF